MVYLIIPSDVRPVYPIIHSAVRPVYPIIPSAVRPAEHDDFLSTPKTPQNWTLPEEEPTSTTPGDELEPSCSNVDPGFPEQTVSSYIAVRN